MLFAVIFVISLVLAVGICLLGGAFVSGAWCWLLPVSTLGLFLFQALLVFLYLLYLCSRVDQSVPQEDVDPHCRKVVNLILESVLPILRIRIRKSGLDKVPVQGRFLLVCNHCDLSDPIILMRCFSKHKLAFISKQENSTMFVIGPMMHRLMGQLINRENDREALKTILTCIRILKEDKTSVGVFPEGGILTEDGKLHHFKPGVFKIAQKAQVPIVVCCLKGTKDVVKNLLKGRGTRVSMEVLEVIPPERYLDMKTVEIAEYCHGIIAESLGPDMVSD